MLPARYTLLGVKIANLMSNGEKISFLVGLGVGTGLGYIKLC